MPIQQSGEMSPFADRLATCVSGGQGMTGLSCPDRPTHTLPGDQQTGSSPPTAESA